MCEPVDYRHCLQICLPLFSPLHIISGMLQRNLTIDFLFASNILFHSNCVDVISLHVAFNKTLMDVEYICASQQSRTRIKKLKEVFQ